MDDEQDPIEFYPVNKTQIRFNAPPDLIFFDTDDEEEEAEFIRVDELFDRYGNGKFDGPKPAIPDYLREILATESSDIPRDHPDYRYSFALIPRHRYTYINREQSIRIRRSLQATASDEGVTLLSTRIRPLFIQWQVKLKPDDDPVYIINLFRQDLENRIPDENTESPFWADDCVLLPADCEPSPAQMTRFINQYQI